MADRLQVTGSGVVVTGAASGIGAGLAERFVADGARVVVCDRDAVALAARWDAVPQVRQVVADLATARANHDLVTRAVEHLGAVDLFCANAGVGTHGGVEGRWAASPQDWQQAWDVNVMSHVHAATALLPGWLGRGRGHLLVTASAAGLLMMLGSAPYTVTKHGALAFAEWMRATYDHRGVTVQALCPQGVRTPMLDAAGALGRALLEPDAIDVSRLVDTVVEALADGRFLVLPHPEVSGYVQAKATDPDGWLVGMNGLQRRVEGKARGARPTGS